MIKNIGFALIVLSAVVLMGSCSGGGHKKKIAKIDSLLVEVEKSTDLLGSVNYDTISHINSIYWETLNEAAKVLKIVPSKEQMAVLEMFGQCKKPFKKYLESKIGCEKELEYTKKQLENLKEGISENQIPKDSIDTYILLEEVSALDIIVEVNQMIEKLNVQKASFDSLYPKVKIIIADLETKITPETKKK